MSDWQVDYARRGERRERGDKGEKKKKTDEEECYYFLQDFRSTPSVMKNDRNFGEKLLHLDSIL